MWSSSMSAFGQKRTLQCNSVCPLCQKQTSRHLFDDLIGRGEQRGRHSLAQRFRVLRLSAR